MNLIRRIDEIIEENSLLKHKFYQMWSDGELDIPMLAGYSMEYYQLVKAVPLFMESILPAAPASDAGVLELNMREEYDHIPLWEDFAAGLGVSREDLVSYAGQDKTRTAVSSLHGLMSECGRGAAAMYALEKEIPKISRTKLEGLAEFYGIRDGATTEYFVQHMEADIRHTDAWRDVLETADSDPEHLVEAAQESVHSQNLILDACYGAYCNNN